MKPPSFSILAMLIAGAAIADTPKELQNHFVQKWFYEEPCNFVIEKIDGNPSVGIDQALRATHAMITFDVETEYAVAPISEILRTNVRHGMTFGFLMGYEAAHPHRRGSFATVLSRLRSDCEKDPSKPAMEYLEFYSE
jgi:hypothetical protein